MEKGRPPATASPSSRWKEPWLRKPVRASWSARTWTAPWISAFCRAIDAWPANSWVSSNSLAEKPASAAPIRPMLRVPIVIAIDHQRDDDHRLGLEGRAGHLDRAWVEVRLVCEDGLAVIDDPAGNADPERALVGQDQIGEPVACDHGAPDPGARSAR